MNKLKLTDLANLKLSDLELNALRGGDCTCGCGCLYQNKGGSNTDANANANKKGGKFSDVSYKVFCDNEWVPVKDGVVPDSDF